MEICPTPDDAIRDFVEDHGWNPADVLPADEWSIDVVKTHLGPSYYVDVRLGAPGLPKSYFDWVYDPQSDHLLGGVVVEDPRDPYYVAAVEEFRREHGVHPDDSGKDWWVEATSWPDPKTGDWGVFSHVLFEEESDLQPVA